MPPTTVKASGLNRGVSQWEIVKWATPLVLGFAVWCVRTDQRLTAHDVELDRRERRLAALEAGQERTREALAKADATFARWEGILLRPEGGRP